jgi:hypothetical protein
MLGQEFSFKGVRVVKIYICFLGWRESAQVFVI